MKAFEMSLLRDFVVFIRRVPFSASSLISSKEQFECQNDLTSVSEMLELHSRKEADSILHEIQIEFRLMFFRCVISWLYKIIMTECIFSAHSRDWTS